jgi:triacylglycerol lipase
MAAFPMAAHINEEISMQVFRKRTGNWCAGLAGAFALAIFSAGNAMAQSEPIIFVHGYNGSSSDFNTMVSRFTGDGYASGKLYRFSYRSTVNDDKTSASDLQKFVATVRANNGNVPVSIVAHSNGGLVTRWYRAKLGGSAEVRRFVSLGSPHKGTQSAYSCYDPACFDMRPNSTFLNDLAGKGCDRSLWSSTDGVIIPAENAKCGTSTQTANVSHLQLLTDASVYRQLRDALK